MDTTPHNAANNKLSIASISQRIAGGIIDIIVTALFLYFYARIPGIGGHTIQPNVDNPNIHQFVFTGWHFIIACLICFLLLGIIEYATQRTPGKYLAKTKTVSKDGHRLKLWQPMVRNIFRMIDKHKQRLGDFCAQTYVVRS